MGEPKHALHRNGIRLRGAHRQRERIGVVRIKSFPGLLVLQYFPPFFYIFKLFSFLLCPTHFQLRKEMEFYFHACVLLRI